MLSKCANYIPMLILILMATLALAQSDPEKFAEGRVALDTHKDCPAAYRALSGVSENGRKDAMWIYYMGKTTECLKKYEDALSYYRAYSKLIPPNAELLNKIGELQYEAHKEAEEQKNADDLAAQKSEAQALAAKQVADEREATAKQIEESADQKKAARGRLPQTLSRLLVLLNSDSVRYSKSDGWSTPNNECTIVIDLRNEVRNMIPLDHIRAGLLPPAAGFGIYVVYTDNRRRIEMTTSRDKPKYGNPSYRNSYDTLLDSQKTQDANEIIALFADASLACSTY